MKIIYKVILKMSSKTKKTKQQQQQQQQQQPQQQPKHIFTDKAREANKEYQDLRKDLAIIKKLFNKYNEPRLIQIQKLKIELMNNEDFQQDLQELTKRNELTETQRRILNIFK